MRVVTYNVLSSHLCGSERNNHCNPMYLDPVYRLTVLKQKLEKEIVGKKSIICLQEVSMVWESNLNIFFSHYGYMFVTAMYGAKKSGYMGIGIAFPISDYRLKNCQITRLADTVQLVVQSDEIPDIWKLALDRMNQMIVLQLEDKQSNLSFCVGNYHMPCLFEYVDVMLIHSTLAAQYIQNLAEDLPYILAGDFNSNKFSPMYNLLTTGFHEKLDHNTDISGGKGIYWKYRLRTQSTFHMNVNQ